MEKIIKIPDFYISKEFPIFELKALFKKNVRISNKAIEGNPLVALNDVTIETTIHDNSYSVLRVKTPSPEFSLRTPNCSPIASTVPETPEIINNMVSDFYLSPITRSITSSITRWRIASFQCNWNPQLQSHFWEGLYRKDVGQIGILDGDWIFWWGWFFFRWDMETPFIENMNVKCRTKKIIPIVISTISLFCSPTLTTFGSLYLYPYFLSSSTHK